MNPLSARLPPIVSEFRNFYLMINSFFLVHKTEDYFPLDQAHFLSVLVVLPVLLRQLLVSRLAN